MTTMIDTLLVAPTTSDPQDAAARDVPSRSRSRSRSPIVRATPDPVSRALLGAIVSGDARRIRALLHDEVWTRALLVHELAELHDADATTALIHGWYGDAAALQVLDAACVPVATRDRITYRVRLKPAWRPDVWHVIEQTGYVRVRDGLVSRLDLTCTGFVPEE